MTTAKRPVNLGKQGKKVWDALTRMAELEEWELVTLLEACRVADRLDALALAQTDQPLTVRNYKGDTVASPFLVESRQQAVTYTRLVASLRIPDVETGKQQQHRGASRAPYVLRSA